MLRPSGDVEAHPGVAKEPDFFFWPFPFFPFPEPLPPPFCMYFVGGSGRKVEGGKSAARFLPDSKQSGVVKRRSLVTGSSQASLRASFSSAPFLTRMSALLRTACSYEMIKGHGGCAMACPLASLAHKPITKSPSK